MWKVTEIATGKQVLVETINKRFAGMIAVSEHGMMGKPVKISLYKASR
jgi:hypothetical protein